MRSRFIRRPASKPRTAQSGHSRTRLAPSGIALGLLALAATAAPGLAQNGLTAAPASLVLAPGRDRTLALSGTSGAIAATASTPAISLRVDAKACTVTVTAVSLGNSVVHVSDDRGDAVDVAVQVLPAAGRVPAAVSLTITGDPASPDFLENRIGAAVAEAVGPTLLPGSTVRASAIRPAPQPLGSGFLTDFRVTVDVDPGPGAAAVTDSTTVDVQNVALPGFQPQTLSFEDDPERITAYGVLSRTTVDAAQPARIYYYHQNIGEPRRFCVVLSANGSVMTHVEVLGAAAGPNIDVMSAGHAATKTFLTREPHNEGRVVGIVGGKPYLERDTPVARGEGIVGSLDLRVLDGGPVTVTVLAIPPTAQPAVYLYAAKLPDDGHTRHGDFDLARFGQRIIAFSAGGPDAAYVYGNRTRTLRNLDPADPGRDYGDYGVLQRVTFDLDNPSAAPATLYLYEKPLGGVVRSSFVVNGTVIDMGCVRVPQRYFVARSELAPRATGAIDVLTMTDGGSNYPLEVGVSSTPPLPLTPPISAPDGCFPKPGGRPAAPQPADLQPGQ